MHSRRPHPAASRGGSSSSAMMHQHQRQRQRQHVTVTGGGNDSNSNSDLSSGNEGIVQKLQGVIAAIRGDRNREHRSRDIAIEKLRSVKEAFQADKATLQADKNKYDATQNESENTQKEIIIVEESIQQLQQKYEFQHEDLIRKREKIQQQNNALEATVLQREKAVHEARQLLDQQRIKFKDLERKEEKKTADLLVKLRLVGKKGNRTLEDADALRTETNNQTEGELIGKNADIDDFEQGQEQLEKKQEEVLSREFKSNVDYAMFPQMIEQKAKVLDTEIEALKIKVTRLEATLAAIDNGSLKGSVGKDSTTFSTLVIDEPQMMLQQQHMANEGAICTAAETMDIDRENRFSNINDGNDNVNEVIELNGDVMMEYAKTDTKDTSVPHTIHNVGT